MDARMAIFVARFLEVSSHPCRVCAVFCHARWFGVPKSSAAGVEWTSGDVEPPWICALLSAI